MNKLILTDCAYLFHWSGSNFYFGTKQQNELHRKINNALRKLYDVNDEARTFVYELNEKGEPVISVDGIQIVCVDTMIKSIEGEFSRKHIINNRDLEIDELITSEMWTRHGKNWFNHKRLHSLSIDSHCNGLQYIQIDFNGRSLRFIKSNKLLYLANATSTPITKTEVIWLLNARSKYAKKQIFDLLTMILNWEK